MAKAQAHPWKFKARFRRHAFGWKSQPAILRIREAVAEIGKTARKDPVLAAEGAVVFLERLSPALENVDSSSGAIGTASYKAVEAMASLIAQAPADRQTREAWLERLFAAHEADRIPYIENLVEHWGEMCATPEVASEWADRLLWITREVLAPDKETRAHFHGTTACLSALHFAGRHDELLEILEPVTFWPYKRWAALALAAKGRKAEAIRLAEAGRGPWSSSRDIDRLCEQILLSDGKVQEAYAGYGIFANLGATGIATFRAISSKYPHKSAGEILSDLARNSPGSEGKWFAAAKDAGLFDEALALATRSPCDPRTLTRAARDYLQDRPSFAMDAGLLALHWLTMGHGYEITSADVRLAYESTMKAAERAGKSHEARERIRAMAAAARGGPSFVAQVLDHELGRTP